MQLKTDKHCRKEIKVHYKTWIFSVQTCFARSFFQLFLEFLKAKTRKQEKTGENGRSPTVIEKNAKKRVDKQRALVYNNGACFAGVFRLHF